MSTSELNIKKLILIPAIVTLAVTLIRLVGELNQWSAAFFNREAGGPGAIVGIVWLVPVFGIYFARILVKSGHGPATPWKVPVFAILGAVVGMGILMTTVSIPATFLALVLSLAAVVAAVALQRYAWPEFTKVMLAYALAARFPVIVVMLFAILGGWGTHYDAPAPGFPEMTPLTNWFWIGFVPQLTFWLMFTVVVGALFAGITALVAKPKAVEKEAVQVG